MAAPGQRQGAERRRAGRVPVPPARARLGPGAERGSPAAWPPAAPALSPALPESRRAGGGAGRAAAGERGGDGRTWGVTGARWEPGYCLFASERLQSSGQQEPSRNYRSLSSFFQLGTGAAGCSAWDACVVLGTGASFSARLSAFTERLQALRRVTPYSFGFFSWFLLGIFIFFPVAGTVLSFGFSMRITLISH